VYRVTIYLRKTTKSLKFNLELGRFIWRIQSTLVRQYHLAYQQEQFNRAVK